MRLPELGPKYSVDRTRIIATTSSNSTNEKPSQPGETCSIPLVTGHRERFLCRWRDMPLEQRSSQPRFMPFLYRICSARAINSRAEPRNERNHYESHAPWFDHPKRLLLSNFQSKANIGSARCSFLVMMMLRQPAAGFQISQQIQNLLL